MTTKYSVDKNGTKFYDSINIAIASNINAEKVYSWQAETIKPSIDVNDILEQLDCDITSEMVADSDVNWSDHIGDEDKELLQRVLNLWSNQFSQTIFIRDEFCIPVTDDMTIHAMGDR